MILETTKTLKSLGGSMSNFCSAIGKPRSLIYRWESRKGGLKDKKPLAKTYPTKISEIKRAEVISEYANSHGISGGWTVANLVGGISASKAREIIREVRPYILMYVRNLEEKLKDNHYEFLKPHVCWSWDYIHIWLGMEKMKLQVLRDECSRHILNWVITSSATTENVLRLISEMIKKFKVNPLVLKRDNDVALETDIFKLFLTENSIIDLPNPPRYAKYQAHHERGNSDLRSQLNLYEINPCITYREMMARVEVVVDYLNNTKPRTNFNGKTSTQIIEGLPLANVNIGVLIAEIKIMEQDFQPMFSGKNGLRKLHRYAVIEVLKNKNLLMVEMEPGKDFSKKILYNHKGEVVNQLKMPFVS